MKRLLDLVAAGAFLLVSWPVLALIALAVRVDSPGRAFFRHERIGRNGVPFDVLKFRSMAPSSGGPELTSGDDARITRIGSILRKYKIDELPQLINVLRGEMSLVGPRPEVKRYVDAYPDEYAQILRVRPGMTDPASLEFHNEQELLAEVGSPEEYYLETLLPKKLALSMSYVEEQSFVGDVRLILQTIAAIAR